MSTLEQIDEANEKLLTSFEDGTFEKWYNSYIKKKEASEIKGKKALSKFIKCLLKNERIDSDTINYNPKAYTITRNNFFNVEAFLDSLHKKELSYKGDFPELKVYFQYKDVKFIYRVLIGQGTFIQFFLLNKDCKFREKAKIVIE